ncbi:hypothetical protein DL764_000630 [Monosporascus ibericus]|uniref:Uncharacterized protein n=1 Tax=Monosporascus ibericus TaxID=155417 RepID=A0A4Q4TW22_9PEZI|nr:hypothetical protein DL764_000630 [Monosporascus ibericus]
MQPPIEISISPTFQRDDRFSSESADSPRPRTYYERSVEVTSAPVISGPAEGKTPEIAFQKNAPGGICGMLKILAADRTKEFERVSHTLDIGGFRFQHGRKADGVDAESVPSTLNLVLEIRSPYSHSYGDSARLPLEAQHGTMEQWPWHFVFSALDDRVIVRKLGFLKHPQSRKPGRVSEMV